MNKQTLYHKAKGGDTRVWSVWSEKDTVFTEYGVLNGQLQTSSTICVGKNIGKANETTPEQQADLEANALYKFKLDRKYSKTIEETEEQLALPMLAHAWKPEKDYTPQYDLWCVQPKYNGVRCLAYWVGDKVFLQSRSGKEYDVAHISKELADFLPKGSILDGELYIHSTPLQEIISLVKKPKVGSTELQYVVYDYPTKEGLEDQVFCERRENLRLLFQNHTFGMVVMSDSFLIENKNNAVSKYHKEVTAKGYEGIMLRDLKGLYLWGYRSNELLKVKAFQDAEFEVVSIGEGVGKMVGHAVLTCKNDVNDLTFNVTPKATMAERKEIFDNKSNYIGRKYTVQFFERSVDDLPMFPVGIAFPEDR